MKSSRYFLGACLVALVGCGGGGGGGGGGSSSAPPLAITQTNAQAVAADVVSAVIESGATSLITGAETQGTVAAPFALTRLNLLVAARMGALQTAPQTVSGVVYVEYCANAGTVTIDAADNGTSATFTFSGCSEYPGETINGTLALRNISGTETNFTARVTLNLVFRATGVPDFSISGGYTLSYLDSGAGINVGYSGSGLTYTYGAETLTLSNFNFFQSIDLTFTPDRYSAYGTATISNSARVGSVTITGYSIFNWWADRDYPHEGMLEIAGANSRLRITVLGNELLSGPQVRIEVDANGDGIYDPAGTIETTWDVLMGS